MSEHSQQQKRSNTLPPPLLVLPVLLVRSLLRSFIYCSFEAFRVPLRLEVDMSVITMLSWMLVGCCFRSYSLSEALNSSLPTNSSSSLKAYRRKCYSFFTNSSFYFSSDSGCSVMLIIIPNLSLNHSVQVYLMANLPASPIVLIMSSTAAVTSTSSKKGVQLMVLHNSSSTSSLMGRPVIFSANIFSNCSLYMPRWVVSSGVSCEPQIRLLRVLRYCWLSWVCLRCTLATRLKMSSLSNSCSS